MCFNDSLYTKMITSRWTEMSEDGWRSSYECCLPGWRRGSKLSSQLARHCCSALAASDTPPTQQIGPTTAYLLCTLALFALCWAHRNYTEIDRYNGRHQTSLPLSIFTRWVAHSYSGLRSRHDSAPAAAWLYNEFICRLVYIEHASNCAVTCHKWNFTVAIVAKLNMIDFSYNAHGACWLLTLPCPPDATPASVPGGITNNRSLPGDRLHQMWQCSDPWHICIFVLWPRNVVTGSLSPPTSRQMMPVFCSRYSPHRAVCFNCGTFTKCVNDISR